MFTFGYRFLVAIGLIIMIYIDSCKSAPACGIDLISGKLTVNCSGFFSLTYKDSTTVHSCDESFPNQVFRSPVIIIKGKCSGVLLGFSSDPYPNKPVDIYFVLFLILLCISILVTIPLLIIVSFIQRVGCSGGDDVQFGKKVCLKARHSGAVFTWTQVILVGLCLQPGRAFCVPPIHNITTHIGTTFTFSLGLNEAACFHNGSIKNSGSKLVHEVTHLYGSVDWDYKAVTKDGCGEALCGTKEECDKWGELGDIVTESNSTFYLKQCIPNRRNIFNCFYAWGCWLTTKKVFLKGKPSAQVYSIGGHTSTPNLEVTGSMDCLYKEVVDTTLDTLRGMSLIDGSRSWICPSPSPLGQPKHSSPGDLQISNSGSVHFDFTGFQCETLSSVSSGSCRVSPPFLSLVNSHCVQLPGFIGSSWVEYANGSLSSIQHDPLIIHVDCPQGEQTVISSMDCYGLKVSVQGVEAEDHLSVIVMSAKSHSLDSIMVVESNCSQEVFTIPCDGQQYGYPLLHTSITTCKFNDEFAVDDRKQPESFDWQWDHPEVHSPLSQHSASLTIVVVAAIIILCVIKILCN